MTRRHIRETREHYEEMMRNTELYFLGEAPENECCPVCGEHDFFNFVDLSYKEDSSIRIFGKGPNVKTRVTGRKLLDYLADENSSLEHLNCAVCNTAISIDSVDRLLPDENFVHYSKKQFKEALDKTFDGDMDKFIYSSRDERAKLYDFLESMNEHYVAVHL